MSGIGKRVGFRNLAILAVLGLLAGIVVAVLPNSAQAATNDADDDGYLTTSGAIDCNDTNPLVHPNDANSYDIPDLGFVDTDCDGVDGNGTTAIKETTSQTDAGLQGDINAICADGSKTGNAKRQILLAGPKTYNNIAVPSSCTGLVLAGGYNNTHTARTTGSNTVTFQGVTGLSVDAATGVVVQLVTITGTAPSQSQGIRKLTYSAGTELTGTPTASTDTQVNYSTSNIESARWAGYLVWPTASGNTVTITANTDDGTRLWVNGSLCVNAWIGQAATDYSCTVSGINTGTLVPFQYEWNNTGGSGNAYLDWAYTGQSRVRVPAGSFRTPEGESSYGLRAVNGAVVDLQRVSASAAAGTAGMAGIGAVTGAAGIRRYRYSSDGWQAIFHTYNSTSVESTINEPSGDNFPTFTGFRYQGYIIAPVTASDYAFYGVTDDGSRLMINGTVCYERWDDSSGTSSCTGRSFTAGQAIPVTMESYDSGGGDQTTLQWSYTGQGLQTVPASAFRLPESDYGADPAGQTLPTTLSRGDGKLGTVGGVACGNCGTQGAGGAGGSGASPMTGETAGARTGGNGGIGGTYDPGNGASGTNGGVSGSGGGNGGAGGNLSNTGGCSPPDAGAGGVGLAGNTSGSATGSGGAKGSNSGQNSQTGLTFNVLASNSASGGPGGTGHAGGGGGGGGGADTSCAIADAGAGGGGGGGGAGGGAGAGPGFAGGGSFGVWAAGSTVVADSTSSSSAAAGGAGGAGARGGTGGFAGRGGNGGTCDGGQEGGGGGGGGGGAAGFGGGGSGGAAGGPSYGVYGSGGKVRLGFTPTQASGGAGGAAGSGGTAGTPGFGGEGRKNSGTGCNAGGQAPTGGASGVGNAGAAGDAGMTGAANGNISNAAPDLEVTVSGVPSSMTAGQASSFVVTVTNNGGSVSTAGPSVSVPLPVGVAFDSGGSSAGCSGSGSPVTVTCSLASLAASGGSVAKTISVVPANVPVGSGGPGGYVGFRATVGTDTGESHSFDNDSRNVGPSLATAAQVNKWADLSVTSATTSDNFRVGVDDTFTVSASNVGGKSTASGSSLTVTLPAGVKYKTATGSGWSCPDYSSAPDAGPISCTRAAGDGVGALPVLSVTVLPQPDGVGSPSTSFATSVTEDLGSGNNSQAPSVVVGHGVQGDFLAQVTDGPVTSKYTVHVEMVSFPSGSESDRLRVQIKTNPGNVELYNNVQTYAAGTLDDDFVLNGTNSSQCSPATASPGGVCYNFAGANAVAPKVRALTTNTFTMSGNVTVKFNVLPLFATSFTGSIQIKDGANPAGSATYWVYPMFNPSTTGFYTS